MKVGSMVFIAAMFIGMGIGMIFHMEGVGTILGMGVGFLLMAMVKDEEKRVSRGRVTGLLAVGGLFIAMGIAMVYYPDIIYPYLIASGLVALGAALIIGALSAIRRQNK